MGIFQNFRRQRRPATEPKEPDKPGAVGEDVRKGGDSLTAYGKLLPLTGSEKQRLASQLTGREHELYLLLLQGFTLKECAQQLGIKYSTANTHMTGLYKKLCINSRAELIINYRDVERTKND